MNVISTTPGHHPARRGVAITAMQTNDTRGLSPSDYDTHRNQPIQREVIA